MPSVKIELLPPGGCLMYAIFLIVSVVLVFIFFIKVFILVFIFFLLAAKDDQEYSQLLLEDDFFDILCQIGYRRLPTKEKFFSRESVIRCAIKKGFLVFNNFAWQWQG